MGYRLALVTGATSGIGLATCERLAQEGIDIMASGRNLTELQRLQDKLSQRVHVQIIQADLARSEGRQRLIAVLHERVPDLVINNAGFGLYGEALTFSTEQQVEILEVNGRAVLELTLEAARALASTGKTGTILNVSSAAGFQIFPNMAVYSASKAFVNNFSQALDFELKPKGIRILTLCPGMVATKFQERAGGKVNQEEPIGVMSASFVAEQIWKQLHRLRPLSIIHWPYRLLTFFSFFVPKSWIAAVEGRLIAKRIPSRTLIKIKT